MKVCKKVSLDCNNNTHTQVRGQHKKSKKAIAKSQPVRGTDITAATYDNNHSTTSVSVSEMSQLQKTTEQLSTIIQNQQATICNLSNKLKFVLPSLDTDDKLGIVDDRTGAAANDRQFRQPVLKFGRIPPDLRSGTSSLRSGTQCKRSAAYNERSGSFQTCHHTVSVEHVMLCQYWRR